MKNEAKAVAKISETESERENILEKVRESLLKNPSKNLAPAILEPQFECEWMPGDASNRFYGRLSFSNQKKAVLMVLNAPEAFKSEEVGGDLQLKELPFVTIGKNWKKSKIKVPDIYFVDSKSEFLICEDFGDRLLFEEFPVKRDLQIYKNAIKELVLIQSSKPFSPISERGFTSDLLFWEFEHFIEYALLKRNIPVSHSQLQELKKFGKKMVDAMTAAPQKVSHRDFHSKNLMILPAGEIGVIDFQDALMGPISYDLASLLRDSYIRLTDQEEDELLKFYEQESGTKLELNLFSLTSLQRNLKAVGRFYYIHMVKGRNTHLPFVGPTMERIFKSLKQIGELKVLSILEALHPVKKAP